MNTYERQIMEETRAALQAALYLWEDAMDGRGDHRHRVANLLRYSDNGLPIYGIALPPAAESVIRRWANTCPTAPANNEG